jgi:hypothetical protein
MMPGSSLPAFTLGLLPWLSSLWWTVSSRNQTPLNSPAQRVQIHG